MVKRKSKQTKLSKNFNPTRDLTEITSMTPLPRDLHDSFHEMFGLIYVTPSQNEKVLKAIEISASYIRSRLIESYMRPIMTYHISDEEMLKQRQSENTEQVHFNIARYIRRIRRKIAPGDSIAYKLCSPSCISYIELIPMEESDKCQHWNILVWNSKTYELGSKSNLMIFIVRLDEDASKERFMENPATEFFYDEDLLKAVRNPKKKITNNMFNITVPYEENTIELALQLMSENGEVNLDQLDYPVYAPIETSLYRTIIKSTNSPAASFSIFSYKNGHDAPVDLFNYLDSNKVPMYVIDPCSIEYPIVDLNEKEYKFINRYAEKNGLHENTPFNLIDVLDNPRYGDTIRIPLAVGSNNIEVCVKYVMNKEKNIVRFIVTHEVDETTNASIVFDYHNISNFVYDDCIVDLRCDYVIKDLNSIKSSVYELEEMSPLFTREFITEVNKLIRTCIDLFKMIQDRPERTKIIHCSKLPTGLPPKPKHEPDRDYTIWKIIKTTYEAKELIRKSQRGELGDREYVMPEWPRVGFWRQTPTGKKVWIDSTICKRRLPLTEKEIHIQM